MTATDASPPVLVEQAEGLVTIPRNRPRRKNAINAAMWNELDAVVTRAETDPTVRALVLTGADGNFSAGADLSGEGSGGLTGHGQQLILHEMRVVGRIIGRLQHTSDETRVGKEGVRRGS